MKLKKPGVIQMAQNPSLRDDTRGLSTVEYVILLVLIAVIAFGVWKHFGEKVKAGVDRANSTIKLGDS